MKGLLSVLIGVAIAAAFWANMGHRSDREDRTFAVSTIGGATIYSFDSDMAPAIPAAEGDATALRFSSLLALIERSDLATTSVVATSGSRYAWVVGGKKEVTLKSKACADGIECLQRISVQQVNPKPAAAPRDRPSPNVITFTTNAYPACRSEQWLQDLIAFVAAKDNSSAGAYFRSSKCIAMKAGERVTVVDWPGVFSGNYGFIHQGQKYWTVREGIDTHR